LIQSEGEVVANPPNDLIYDFKGYFESKDLAQLKAKKQSSTKSDTEAAPMDEDLIPDDDVQAHRESLSLENTMWANTVLASSGHVLGMIVYTGVETRA